MKSLRSLPLAAGLVGALSAPAWAEPSVVVSVKPLHSLVAGVMGDIGTPQLIVEGAASPHRYSLKPTQARALQNADVVFWFGPQLTPSLEKPIETLASKASVVPMSKARGLRLLKFREGGPFEGHAYDDHAEHAEHEEHDHAEHAKHEEHDHAEHAEHEEHDHAEHAKHDDHGHGGFDVHIWLDPMNAKAMVHEIEETLAAADPANAATYEKNAEALESRIDRLTDELGDTLAPVTDRPYIVFHDAYQYFEARFGLKAVGSITVSPEVLPGAERVSEIRDKVRSLGATCVFAEPQFEPKLVKVVTEGTDAKSGVLDPLGASIADGPDLYFDVMRGLASSLRDCLAADS